MWFSVTPCCGLADMAGLSQCGVRRLRPVRASRGDCLVSGASPVVSFFTPGRGSGTAGGAHWLPRVAVSGRPRGSRRSACAVDGRAPDGCRSPAQSVSFDLRVVGAG